MAKEKVIFKLTAFSAAAGKYNPNAPLDGNEDNFYVNDDLADNISGHFKSDEKVVMSDYGCLMVVADGMGGMNAGEVASAIAIETVREFFAPGRVDLSIAENSNQRRKYLEQVIKEADRRIKNDSKRNPEHEGMGSTIILAWIVGDKITVSWCGDSRAYRYNPSFGIQLLSRDHSYVQELANQGIISYEDTFEHPQGNIVTRSLGDPSQSAQPETKEYDIYNGDIILLCSDGLSGVLRDKKTKDPNGNYYPGDTIEEVIANHTSSIIECRDALMDAAEKADWYDNVTVILCQIISGGKAVPPSEKQETPIDKERPINPEPNKDLKKRLLLWGSLVGLLIIGLSFLFYFIGLYKGKEESNEFGNPTAEDVEVNSVSIIPSQDDLNPPNSNQNQEVKEKGKESNLEKSETPSIPKIPIVGSDTLPIGKEIKENKKESEKKKASENINNIQEDKNKGSENSKQGPELTEVNDTTENTKTEIGNNIKYK